MVIALGIMTYYYFYYRKAYFSAAYEMVRIVEETERLYRKYYIMWSISEINEKTITDCKENDSLDIVFFIAKNKNSRILKGLKYVYRGFPPRHHCNIYIYQRLRAHVGSECSRLSYPRALTSYMESFTLINYI